MDKSRSTGFLTLVVLAGVFCLLVGLFGCDAAAAGAGMPDPNKTLYTATAYASPDEGGTALLKMAADTGAPLQRTLSGDFANQDIELQAEAKNGFVFSGWDITPSSVVFQSGDASSASCVIVAPEESMVAQANFTSTDEEDDDPLPVDNKVTALSLTGLVDVPMPRRPPELFVAGMYLNNENDLNRSPDQWRVTSLEWRKGGIAFTGAEFVSGTVYTARLTLDAKSGYTFTGLPANAFTSLDGVVTCDAGSGDSITVDITFPATTEDFGAGFGV
jgi:hypothetical protein